MTNQAFRDLLQLKETLERMSGQRGDATKSSSAVRRSELRALGSLTMRSKRISAAPTQSDYNALQADVESIFKALQRISNVLGNATLPEA